MSHTSAKRNITQLDICVGSSLVGVILVLAVNTLIRSLPLIYAVVVLILGGLAYCTKKFKAEWVPLRNLWILGVFSVVFYPVIDSFFVTQLRLVVYLTEDPRLIETPVYIPLYWILGVLLFGYIYYRVYEFTGREWIGALAAGLFSALSAVIVENFFNAAGFYQNTPSGFMIGNIPVYVPLGYFIAFLFMPFYIRYKYFCGFLLYGFVGICWYLFSLILP